MARSWIIKRVDQASLIAGNPVSTGIAVQLPYGPKRIVRKNPVKVSETEIAGALPIVISFRGTQTMTWEGTLGDGTLTNEQIETSFINTLVALQGSGVIVRAPGSRYDGLWLYESFDYEETGGQLMGYQYTINFRKGQTIIPL